MIIELLNNMSAPNMINKNCLHVQTLEGYIKDATSILEPTITVELDNPTGFNYFHIPEFQRYYFVTGVSSVTNNLISIAGTVDALFSFRDQILQCTAVIKRQENQYNLYLDDGIFKAYQNPKHKIIKFPYGFNAFSYILALAGNS